MATRAWLVIVMLAACEKAHDAPPAAGSATDPAVDALAAEMTEYGETMLPMMIAFDGDCSAFADRMLTLEPLAQAIRSQSAALDSDPARKAAVKERLRAMKDTVEARFAAKLKPLGATLADVDRKEAEIKAKCGGDPKFRDAEQRTGLKKKK